MGTLDPHEQGGEPTPLPEEEALEWKEREAARAQGAHGTCVRPTRPRVPEKYAGAHSNEATSDAARRIGRYWAQRHRLFSRFDEGVRLDAESWFSVPHTTILPLP